LHYIQGHDRSQSTLFPEVLDDYIGDDNPVRFIDAFVDKLDLVQLGFSHASIESTGRPPYNPSDFLKLYIYGYLNRIRSSRQLEKAAERNVEVMWLLKRLLPDFKTISDFRKDNTTALKKVFREFTLLCKDLDLFGAEFIAIDGSKFSASNHNSRTYTRNGLKKTLEEIDAKIRTYTKLLDKEDRRDDDPSSSVKADDLHHAIDHLKDHKLRLEEIQKQVHENPEQTQISLTDPDSRKMLTGNKGTDVCYNVQMSVDSKNKLIIDLDATNDVSDERQLYRMAVRAKEILGVSELSVTADKGYYNQAGIKRCQEEDIQCYLPQLAKSQNRRLGMYTDKDFQYDSATDSYRCPAGQDLTYRGTIIRHKKETRYYKTRACRTCPTRTMCTRNNKEGRIIYRWIHEAVIEEMNRRVMQEPDKLLLRKCLVEHPFGTIKQSMDGRSFLLRTFEKVGAEVSLLALAYNIKRVLNILGITTLLDMLRARVNRSFVSSIIMVLKVVVGQLQHRTMKTIGLVY